MAEANILGLSCSICLDLLKDPVTLHCGHSFCMVCINDCWDQEDQKGVYSCPQCRQTFTPRPAVSKNIALAEVVETLKKTGFQSTPPAQCSAGPEDVECDFCTERKHKAIKSCLVCLASFCETHLQPHYKSPAFKKHKLVEASRRLQEQICSQHDKLLEVYCRTDQQCICMLCTMDQHKGHDTVSAAAERAEKQKLLLEVKERCQQKIQEREQELQELTQAVAFHKLSAQTALQESERIFSELVKTIKKRHSELKELIRAQVKAEVSQAENVMKQLEQEIAELKRRDTEMEALSQTEDTIYFLQLSAQTAQTALQRSRRIFSELVKINEKRRAELKELIRTPEKAAVSRAEKVMKQLEQEIAELKTRDPEMEELSHTEDTIYFLQNFQSLITLPGSEDLPSTVVSSFLFFEDVLKSVFQLQEMLEACFIEQFVKISGGVNKVLILHPQSREEFLQYSCQLTLDPNTASQRLHLSDSDRMATDHDIQYEYSYSYDLYGNQIALYTEEYEHPESFNCYSQVLCRESVSEPCYWEVEWSGSYGVSIAVAYKDITRKGSGHECVFGYNDKSWSLQCYPSSCSFLHNSQETNISMKPTCSKIGVFVDQKAGTLSFYSVSDTMNLLHRVRTTFTQPLYPGFGLNFYSTVKLCD